MTQRHIDGIVVDQWKASFKGDFDLDENDIDALELDRIAFLVVAVRVKGMTAQFTNTSDVRRKNILEVSDAVVTTGELRLAAVAALQGKGAIAGQDERLPLSNEQLGLAPADGPEHDGLPVDIATGEIVEDPTEGEVEVISAPPKVTNGLEEMPVDGPKAGKFDPDVFGPKSDPEPESESVGGTGYGERGDKRLARFMQSGK